MKQKKHDIGIKELFRQNLENIEVIPDPALRSKIMHKVGKKEFLRFNPARFNIFYLGVIIATTMTAGLLLFTGNNDHDTHDQLNKNVFQKDTETYFSIPSGKVIRKTSDKTIKKNMPDHIDTVNDKIISDSIVENIIPAGKETAVIIPGLNLTDRTDKNIRSNGLKGKLVEEPLFEPSVFAGCSPLKLHFKNKVNSDSKFSWIFGDGGYSDQKDPDWIFDSEGVYQVILNVYNPDGSVYSSSVNITVYPRPIARFEFVPEKAVIPDDEIRFINYSTHATDCIWNFGDGKYSDIFEPKHKYQKFGSYDVSLRVTSEHGCIDTMVIANAFSGSGYFIDMPNAFIPNSQGPSGGVYSIKSDESAEVFHPVFSGVSEYQLKIFSKLGILIFESNDVNIGWDGYFKGQLSNPGVYIWKIKGNFRNGEPFMKMGDVTLLKN